MGNDIRLLDPQLMGAVYKEYETFRMLWPLILEGGDPVYLECLVLPNRLVVLETQRIS